MTGRCVWTEQTRYRRGDPPAWQTALDYGRARSVKVDYDFLVPPLAFGEKRAIISKNGSIVLKRRGRFTQKFPKKRRKAM